ncbi:CDA2 [Candida theae]|uniref:chitin deacetylase n=1 Tax=Candida theae TaxID=1198502 RepID=A0AAD5BCH9_9ASCO|nr:CDA2 [Candida theae]KAI5954877.1 CDA2 [Candida theae]
MMKLQYAITWVFYLSSSFSYASEYSKRLSAKISSVISPKFYSGKDHRGVSGAGTGGPDSRVFDGYVYGQTPDFHVQRQMQQQVSHAEQANANANANANAHALPPIPNPFAPKAPTPVPVSKQHELPPSPMIYPPKLPFPQWLTDFTGLHEWPGLDPPYIPLDFIDFNKIVPVPLHPQASCSAMTLRSPSSCSFDCFNCVEVDDVYTCPKLSQTFDDGPSPYTLKLLDALNLTHTQTTFFTLGVNIVRFPEVYQLAMRSGHIMGSHTWSHKFLPGLSNEGIIAQIEWSIWSMNATGHHLPKWFRPPYGGIDNRVRSILRQFGMQAVLWDFDTFDWKMLDHSNMRNEEDVYNDVRKFKQERMRGRGGAGAGGVSGGGNGGSAGGLILEHDAIQRTVDVGIEILKNVVGGGKDHQLTVPKCVGGIDYIKSFKRD